MLLIRVILEYKRFEAPTFSLGLMSFKIAEGDLISVPLPGNNVGVAREK